MYSSDSQHDPMMQTLQRALSNEKLASLAESSKDQNIDSTANVVDREKSTSFDSVVAEESLRATNHDAENESQAKKK